MTDLDLKSKAYTLNFIENSPQYKSSTFEAKDVQLDEIWSFVGCKEKTRIRRDNRGFAQLCGSHWLTA